MLPEPTRPLQLLKSAKIALQKDPAAQPAELPKAKQAWTYATADGRLGLWLYEYSSQDDLDEGMTHVDEQLVPAGRAMDFAQNGEWLLVITLKASREKEPDDREAMGKLLQAFSGEVER
ncbi:MAG: hypothetical protein FJ116_08755 [Deltaproteobacteria bacterium]|nr:hypothetical protein [Deltaproteobacteria bacterium]